MDNSLSLGQRIATAFVAAATILATLGVAGLSLPQQASAASAGDLIRGTSLSDVYFYGWDGMRYVFPNEKTFMTWQSDFSGVDKVSDSTIASIEIGGNVVVRPGTEWVKITSSDKTYAVSTNGMIHWIETEAVASAYAGSNWNQGIIDVPDVYFGDYTEGASLQSAVAFDGMLYTSGGKNYVAWGGEAREVTSAGRSANMINSKYFLDGTGFSVVSLDAGTSVSGYECALSDASQAGCEDEAMTGDITLSLSSSTPEGTRVPQQANGVEVLRFNVKAGSEAATFSQVALKMDAVGATSNVSSVYLYEGAERLTDARTINSSTRMVTFGSLGLALAAGETRTLSVRVTVANAGTGDDISFSIMSAGDVEAAGGDIAGSFPISGETFEIASVDAGSITVTKSGTIVDPVLGQQDATIGKFKLAVSSEDASVEEITLKIDDSGDHSDYKLWLDDELVGTGSSLDDDLVAFDLTNAVEILDGDNEILEVTADIGGEADDTIKVYIDNAVDVLAIGADYDFGLTVDIGTSGTYNGADGGDAGTDTCSSSSDNCSFSTIEGGEITFAYVGPSTSEVQTNGDDQVLLEFSLATAQNIEVDSLAVLIQADDNDNDPTDGTEDGDIADDDGLLNTATVYNLDNIRLVNKATGLTLNGPEDLSLGDDAEELLTFTDGFGMEAGESIVLQITADVHEDMENGTEILATLDISAFDADGEDGNAIPTADIVPSTDIAGPTLTAETPSLVLGLASVSDTTTVHGASGVLVNGFEFEAGDAADVTINEITVNIGTGDLVTGAAATDGTFDAGDCLAASCTTFAADVLVTNYISTCSLYNGDTLLDGPVSPTSSGVSLVFDDVNFTAEAGEFSRIDLKCNMADPSAATDVFFAFDIADGAIVAEDSKGQTVEPTGDAPNGALSAPDIVLSVKAQGTLAVTVDSAAPSSDDFLIAGTTDNLVTVLNFAATYEDIRVDEFQVSEEDGLVDGLAGKYADNIEQLTIVYDDATGTEVEKSASMSTSTALAKFTSLDLLVEKNEEAKIYVYADLQDHARNDGGADSNDSLNIEFEETGFDGYGLSSRKDYTSASTGVDDTATSATFVVKEAAPTIELNSLSPSGTGYVAGTNDVLVFDIKVTGEEDILMNHIVFDVDAADSASAGWNSCENGDVGGGESIASWESGDFVLENGDSEEIGTATLLIAAGTTCADTDDGSAADIDATEVVEFVSFAFSTPELLAAGDTTQFTLSADTTGAAANDSIQVNIPSELWVASTWTDRSDINDVTDVQHTDLDIVVDATTSLVVGSILCITEEDTTCDSDEEIVLVTKITGTTLTVARGYRGSDIGGSDAGAELQDGWNFSESATPYTSFLWQDDGSGALASNTNDGWGAYLVDELTVSGRPLQF